MRQCSGHMEPVVTVNQRTVWCLVVYVARAPGCDWKNSGARQWRIQVFGGGGEGTRKSGLTGGLSRAPYTRVCKFWRITRPIFSNNGGYVPLDPPVAPSLAPGSSSSSCRWELIQLRASDARGRPDWLDVMFVSVLVSPMMSRKWHNWETSSLHFSLVAVGTG